MFCFFFFVLFLRREGRTIPETVRKRSVLDLSSKRREHVMCEISSGNAINDFFFSMRSSLFLFTVCWGALHKNWPLMLATLSEYDWHICIDKFQQRRKREICYRRGSRANLGNNCLIRNETFLAFLSSHDINIGNQHYCTQRYTSPGTLCRES